MIIKKKLLKNQQLHTVKDRSNVIANEIRKNKLETRALSGFFIYLKQVDVFYA